MQDAQRQRTIDEAARENMIRRLPITDRLKDLYLAVDGYLRLLLKKGAALQDDGGTLIGDISQAVLLDLMQCSSATVQRTLARNREIDPPFLDVVEQRDPMTNACTSSQFELHWPRILQSARRGVHCPVKGGSSPREGGFTQNTSEKQVSAPPLRSSSTSPTPTNFKTETEKSNSISEAGGLSSFGEDVGDGPQAETQTVIWGGRLRSEQLTEPADLCMLYATALEQGAVVLDEMSLADWFAWGHYCGTARGIMNPVAVFTKQLAAKDRFGKTWREKIRAEDRGWAEKQLRHKVGAKEAQAIRIAVEQAARRSPHAKQRIVGGQCLADSFVRAEDSSAFTERRT